MKKLLIAASLITLLSACSEEPTYVVQGSDEFKIYVQKGKDACKSEYSNLMNLIQAAPRNSKGEFLIEVSQVTDPLHEDEVRRIEPIIKAAQSKYYACEDKYVEESNVIVVKG